MFKKILIGIAAVAIFGSIAGAGYSFGKYIAQNWKASAAQQRAPDLLPRR